MKHLRLCGMGTAVPEVAISQEDAASYAQTFVRVDSEHARKVSLLYRRTGVEKRHSVVLQIESGTERISQDFYPPACSAEDRGPTLTERMQRYEDASRQLSVRASRAALMQAQVAPERVTHLITVSCTGFSAPGFDLGLLDDVPLSTDVARTHLGFMGCHGLLNALRVAHAFALADPSVVILICAVELCSLHQQYGWDAERIVANSLFADGAAAIVACSSALPLDPPSLSTPCPWRLAASGSVVLPESASHMSWRIRDHGFEMGLSPQVPALIEQHLGNWLEAWLAKQGLTIPDIRQWAVHPGGPKILQATGTALRLDDAAMRASFDVLRRFGNMSSPTVAFVLEELARGGAQSPCLLLGFGPGITIEVGLLV